MSAEYGGKTFGMCQAIKGFVIDLYIRGEAEKGLFPEELKRAMSSTRNWAGNDVVT